MKGVILAGGNGKRLEPLTIVTNKHLLPVYKKPMIFYPLETMVKAGIKDIVIVTSGDYIGHFYRLLGTGAKWGVDIHYEIQEGSGGTGVALLCAKRFIQNDDFMVILGDNIISENIKQFVDNFEEERNEYDAKILIAKVDDPLKYGVVEFDGKKITRLVEKPKEVFSNYVNTGLWMFKADVLNKCRELKLSERNEYEITDILSEYATEGKLTYELLESEWTDAGTFEQLYKASILMRKMELEKKSE